ncbi:MAG TPA: 3-hydroxyacyl-ACP dehydratase FabZ [Bdellovibrionota bacterium]|nr:3-hydroxyacyl-ACP dehydratase FabZ [Bdellovibrionota bacterium]
MTENPYRLDIEQIQSFLPHRQPFLFIDRVLEIHPTGDLADLSSRNKEGTRVVAQKCVSFGEAHFHGHFPGFSIMPGVLVIETMAQAASFSIYPYIRHTSDKPRQVQCVLVGVDSTRFRKPIVPGDVVRIETLVKKTRGPLWAFECQATVEGQRVAEAEVMANWTMGLNA